MPVNEIANMLYSILIILSTIFGALNLHLYLKNKKILETCKRLESENDTLHDQNQQLKTEILKCNDSRTKK